MILLAATSDEYFVISIFAAGFGILVYYFVARWIFKVDTNLDIQRRQLNMLIEIAKKLDVPIENIYKALDRPMPKK